MADPAAQPRYANPLTILGAALTTISAVLFLFFFFLDLAGFHTNPYLGIVTFLLLPGVFVTGLLLMPLGLWRERRRLAAGAPARAVWPTIDLRQARVRWIAALVALFTCVNFVILGLASFKGVEYADSQSFCTGACHTPMEPQAVANLSSVHAAVTCAQCHIAPGAPGFVKAKWGGIRQLGGVVMNTFPRPLPSPVHTLPAAEGTCLACHTPTAHVGDVVRQIRTYADDEAATESVTTLTMRVGGGNRGGGPQIHWHANPANRIEYIATDDTREVIPWAKVTSASGEVREYIADGVTPAQLAAGERRLMDCTDCHNRLGHPIAPSAERAIDDALAEGRLPKLPFIRREAVTAVPRRRPRSRARRAADSRAPRRVLRPARSETRRRRARGPGDCDRAAGVRGQRVPGHERDVGHICESAGPHRGARLLPVPRRFAQDEHGPGDQPGLRELSSHGVAE